VTKARRATLAVVGTIERATAQGHLDTGVADSLAAAATAAAREIGAM
jgi:hypothetical protein